MTKPRIRVKARASSLIHVGGVSATVSGYDRAFSDQISRFLRNCNVFKIELLAKSGDYDKYRVIHD
jgi:hypothetical protein